jgi:phosphonate transport system substrate-binding protein
MKKLMPITENIKKPLISFLIISTLIFLFALQVVFPVKANEVNSKKTAVAEKPRILVIGEVNLFPKKQYFKMKPIADYVAWNMKDLGITGADILIAKSNEQMVQYLKEGKVDWLSETIFSSLVLEKKAGAEIILRRWKKNVPEYHTLFFVRKDSGITSLKDLRGKIIALEEPSSTTACFVPSIELLKKDLKIQQLESTSGKPFPDRVGYVFARKEINISSWVYKDLTDAGAFSNLDWNNERKMPLAFKKDLKIIYRSNPIPRAAVLVRKDLSPVMKSRLKKILLNMHKDPKAVKILQAYQGTKKFDAMDEKTNAVFIEMRSFLNTFSTETGR